MQAQYPPHESRTIALMKKKQILPSSACTVPQVRGPWPRSVGPGPTAPTSSAPANDFHGMASSIGRCKVSRADKRIPGLCQVPQVPHERPMTDSCSHSVIHNSPLAVRYWQSPGDMEVSGRNSKSTRDGTDWSWGAELWIGDFGLAIVT